ncbi:MAG TPA: SUMF1/EgtB/PvdO family nonheme iron enzyme, partial [Pyrinomonadaceae bacterium]
DSTEAYALATEAEKYIPNDPQLAALFAKISLKINVRTEPSGARVYTKDYKSPGAEWKFVGLSPIDQLRVPIGILRWKIEKEGYETVLAAATTFNVDISRENLVVPYDLTRVLVGVESAPQGMVRVTGAKTKIGTVEDFYIDRYEVTNSDYKKFIDNGGYRRKEYWKHAFTDGSKTLSWEEAMAKFVDQTGRSGPATWQAGDYPAGQGNYPVGGISWYEAAAYAEFVGKQLPTETHWHLATGGATPLILFPQLGGFAVFAPFSNFLRNGPVEVGSLSGITAYGAFDMAGNLREWCWNETAKGRLLRGGAWGENIYSFSDLSQAPPMDRSVKNGFRCAFYPDSGNVPSAAFDEAQLLEVKDHYDEEPVADEVFQVYRDNFSYDKIPLDAQVESKTQNPEGWVHEKISFNAPYAGERIIAHLFLPSNATPPYQTVIYYPGSASYLMESSNDIEAYYEFPLFLSFIVKNGRAVLYPVYSGTFERRKTGLTGAGDSSRQFAQLFMQEVQDFRRCIDYLETRADVDTKKIAYYGMSGGGWRGGIIPAVEDRVQTSVLVAGGFNRNDLRPEIAQINYLPRIRIPTRMLNGKYDTIHPYETSIKPMFDLLGTPRDKKELKLYETDHIPPRNELIKETLAWLDKYLGPTR